MLTNGVWDSGTNDEWRKILDKRSVRLGNVYQVREGKEKKRREGGSKLGKRKKRTGGGNAR